MDEYKLWEKKLIVFTLKKTKQTEKVLLILLNNWSFKNLFMF